MHLDNFEKFFTSTILKRGENYFRSGNVIALEKEDEVGPEEWYAQVEGNYDDYEVEVVIEPDGRISAHACDCPYGVGCKHVAAVLFEIRQRSQKVETRVVISKVKAKERSADELMALYPQLDETDQRLLKIFAVLWDDTTQTKLLEVFKQAGFKYNGVNLYSKNLKPHLEKLLREGFVLRMGNNVKCQPEFAHALCERYFAEDAEFPKTVQPIQQVFPSKSSRSWYYEPKPQHSFRDMRIARYLGKEKDFERCFFELLRYDGWGQNELVEYWFGKKFDFKKVEAIPEKVRTFLLDQRLTLDAFSLAPLDSGYFEYASKTVGFLPPEHRSVMAYLLAQFNFLRGDWEQVKLLSTHLDEVAVLAYGGIREVLSGDAGAALTRFGEAQKMMRKQSRINTSVLQNMAGVFHILAYLQARDEKHNRAIEKHVRQVTVRPNSYSFIFGQLLAVVAFLQNDKPMAEEILSTEFDFPLHQFFQFFAQFWVDEKLVDKKEATAYRQMLAQHGYAWMAAEMNALLGEMGLADEALPLPEEQPLVHLLPRIEEWENALKALLQLGGKSKPGASGGNRIAWLVNFEKGQAQARHQTLSKSGSWTKGRKVAFERLRKKDVPGLTPQDMRFVNAVGYAYGSELSLSREPENWKHLVGHPLLFLEKSPTTAVQLVEVKPRLIAQRTDAGGYRLRLDQDIEFEGAQVIKETPTRYKYIEADEAVVQIVNALNGRSLDVPAKAESQLQEALTGLANLVDIQSALEDEKLPTVEADSRPFVHLLPVGDGFHVELYAKPFRDAPPYVKLGEGEPYLVGTLAGERTATQRDLRSEKGHLKNLRSAVPTLKNHRPSSGIWKLEDSEACLQFLLELQPLLGSGDITLEWPKGEKYRIDSVAGFDKFKMSVGDGSRWFEVNGELRVDEEKVLTLQELLALSEQQSQFVEVSPGKFLALTEEFRQRLKSINGLLAKPKKKGGAMQLHPLAAPALEGFTDMVDKLELSQKFKESQARLEAAFAKKFKPSAKFKAKLRPYQKEGFQWLHRCAAWEVGACLADDMGLGKTIQALAFLTDRAKLGPALVVAPASVCRNWRAETEKFAPSLLPVLFGEGDRAATMEEAGKGDVIIVTYDLMAREAELFTQKKWATAILDEAQAIKNRATKRSETAMNLQADFRLAMSGTPIENHLGELWNLFQFINPGLLGSAESFSERFAAPIEKYKDDNRREQLRRLVQPFILRRRKDEVLKDLPEKTEVTLTVELPPNERAFYEALRRNALEKLTSTADDGQAGQQHLRILAEIMKLRRAACHPQLADANAGFKSSAKLELFSEIVDELLENGHKALVFSQFVGHLKILEKYLKKQKISYQYLDGSTPLKKREQRIDAFQAGEGEVFLISLKAGGTGLNLTAADYVIHTDPWWNPAVEDQATDRAHRIGQERPVTVYRLVVENSIEEKILELHAQKRDLADSLLTGTDVSAKLSAEDLMKLLKEGV